MKTYLHDNLLVLIGLIFGAIFYGSYQSWTAEEPEPIYITEYKVIEAEPEIITEVVYLPSTEETYRNFTDREAWCLCDLGMREAENQGVIGQCWVMYTALCRCEAFGKSIEEVWASSAFESSRRRSGLTPNEDCLKALALIEEGWTPRPLWFQRDNYHGFGTPLCKVGDHCFSCK